MTVIIGMDPHKRSAIRVHWGSTAGGEVGAMDVADNSEVSVEEIPVLTPDGEMQRWTVWVRQNDDADYCVRLTDGQGTHWDADGGDVFDAFAAVRSEPGARGFRFLVVGARLDCWPSGMSSSMSGGVLVYRHYRSALQRLVHDLVDVVSRRGTRRYIFDAAPVSRVATAAEQATFREQWRMRIL
ncbi:hypothetical protein [Nocardia sp. NPDC050793]|uniref:hypothetical protein n=1 Tax=Nocardia sp. NPDC050793 TaxID=3155159 RepID=UPI0033F037E6